MIDLEQYLEVTLQNLKKDLGIAIIYAGNPEKPKNICFRTNNPRHWKSYKSVAEDIRNALSKLGFDHLVLLEEGKNLAVQLSRLKIDFAWLNTAGVQGLDSSCHCAALLESLGIPYVGHTPVNTALMDNKHLFKMFLNHHGIRTAPSITWNPVTDLNGGSISSFQAFQQTLQNMVAFSDNVRFVVKPVCGRASNFVSIVDTIEDALSACKRVFDKTHNSVLVEPFLPGREYCVAVMGSMEGQYSGRGRWQFFSHNSPRCFSQFERNLEDPLGIFTSIDTKAISASSIRPLNHKGEQDVIIELNNIASAIYQALGLHALIRVDLRMDNLGRLHVLEANPKPDIKAPSRYSTSLVSLGIEQLGISYESLILNQLTVTLSHFYHYRKQISTRLYD